MKFISGCLYQRYRPYRWTRFLRPTSCPWNNANYLFHQRIRHIHRWCIHFPIGTDGQPRFTDGKLPLPSVTTVPMDKVFEGSVLTINPLGLVCIRPGKRSDGKTSVNTVFVNASLLRMFKISSEFIFSC